VTGRREQLLDAAIEVLGGAGIHGLTHRAVDAAAGLPTGSTSNHFRTRDSLLGAVIERIFERERAAWEELAATMYPVTPHDLARTLTVAAQLSTGRNRALTLARYAILVESAIHPALREQVLATGSRVNAWAFNWIRVAGSSDPERDAPIVMNHWTGIVLHDLAVPDPAFDPYPQISALVEAVVGAHTPEVTS